MIESPPVRTVLLGNGITLRFHDCSNRYYGDFHRVLIVVEGIVDLDAAFFSDEQKSAAANLENTVLYRQELARMGVVTEHLAATVCNLIDSFLDSVGAYLGRPDIPGQLLKKRLAEKGKRRSSLRRMPLG